MKFRWSFAATQPALAAQLADQLKIPALLVQCLLNRGLTDAAGMTDFLQPRLKGLADPFLVPNMEAAVERLFVARSRGERVVIFGDYDVDGVTSTALLLEVLGNMGWSVEHYVPHRLDEGYGLTQEAVGNCLRKYPTTLLLAVDCGSTAVDTVVRLRKEGVDVIVLDHHQVSFPPPDVIALVNPRVASAPGSGQTDGARFTELCSVGLSFKLAHALVKQGRQVGLVRELKYDVRSLLDLVAVGTIADLVPLTGENRILVASGLERLNRTPRPGLLALKQVAHCSSPLGAHEVGFQLGPRLNAAGRLETAEEALRLLTAPNFDAALSLARTLDVQNRERRRIESEVAEEVFTAVQSKFNPEKDFVIVEGQLLWHVGVVGIVASRVLQRFYRPTIILGGDGPEWRGSGRSIAGFDLAGALRECDDLLVRHGGHAMAAGVAIQPHNVEGFRARLNELAKRALREEQPEPVLRLDSEVKLGALTLGCLTELDQLEPTGHGNSPVQLCTRNVAHYRPLQRLGSEQQHIKMWLSDGSGWQEVVWWGAGSKSPPAGRFDVAYVPNVNEYHGRRTVQLKLLDWRPAQMA
jgi:single-stranded-DNA-specific exonuclease